MEKEGEAVVGRERERAMGGVLLFAEGAACRQGCAPIRSATDVPFATPQQLTALGSVVRDHAAHHAWRHRLGKCIDLIDLS